MSGMTFLGYRANLDERPSESHRFVYALLEDSVPYYVGATSRALRKRLNGHCHARPGVEVRILGMFAEDEWQAAEQRWIARLRESGAILENATDGGEPSRVGWHHNVETLPKLASAKGKTRAASAVKATAEWHRGRKRSEETRRKLSDAAAKRSLQLWTCECGLSGSGGGSGLAAHVRRSKNHK